MPLKRRLLFLAGLGWAGFFIVVVISFMAFSAATATMTTDTHSSNLPNDQAKIEFLKKYLEMYSEIEATEFHIRYDDNSTGLVPGPSDWDMQVVMKVAQNRLASWTAGLQKTEETDLSWAYDLLPKNKQWAIHSTAVIYTRGKTVVAVFEPEGIVFKRVTTE
jgi:hypothetical protein